MANSFDDRKKFSARQNYGGQEVSVTVGSPAEGAWNTYGVAFFAVDGKAPATYFKRDELAALISHLQFIYENTGVKTLPPADAYRMENGLYMAPVPDTSDNYAGNHETAQQAIKFVRDKVGLVGLPLSYWSYKYGKTFVPVHITEQVVEDSPVTISA